jgi:hypothetical protein
VVEPAVSTVSPVWHFTSDRPASLSSKAAGFGIGMGMLGSSFRFVKRGSDTY